ncbi:response regulator [bacterium]|nr:response regulator [bacterium]
MSERRKKRVLVVDDDATLLELLVDTLEAVGYETVPAPGGIEALEELTRQSFDVMVTDVKMPGVDGISLLKKVRRHYPDLPVLFITGVATPDIIASADPDGYLAKPFRISKIEEMIEATIQRKEHRTANTVRRVLVVDTDQQFSDMISDALSVSQFMAFVVPSGSDALRELGNGEFDAVIADLAFPDMEWPEFHEKVKAESPGLPIILTSADHDERSIADQLHGAEVDAYLQKPFPAGEMIALLNKITPVPNG